MNPQWYTADQQVPSDILPSDEQPPRPWIARWWPGVAAVVVVIVVVALLAVLLPGGNNATGSTVRETPDRPGVTTGIAPGDTQTGERVIEGDEAVVGGGRDTRLRFGHVTVLVPNGSVEGEGTIRIARVSPADTPEGLERVADAVDVTLDGTVQSGPFTMEVSLPDDVGPMSFQATETGSGRCCEVESGEWDPQRRVLSTEVEHLSVKSFFSYALDGLEEFVAGLIGDRFSAQLASVDPPVCPNDDYPQTDRWAVVSDDDGSIKWCLDRLDSGGRELRIRNAKRHAVALRFPVGFPAVRPELPFALSSLFTKASEALTAEGKGLVVLQRGDQATVDVSSIPDGYRGRLTAVADVLVWTGDLFDIALDVLIATFARVPSWSRPADVPALANRAAALRSLDQTRCVAAIATGEELASADIQTLARIAGRLAACLSDWLAGQGLTGWLLASLSSVAGIPGATLAALISAGSVAFDGSDYSIIVNRLAPAAPKTPATPSTSTPRNTATPSTVPKKTCPTIALGHWTGRWYNNTSGSGTFETILDSVKPQVTGTFAFLGSAYEPARAITGSVQCAHISFGRIDQLVEFTGDVSANGRSMTGTYRTYDSDTLSDTGTFTAEFGN